MDGARPLRDPACMQSPLRPLRVTAALSWILVLTMVAPAASCRRGADASVQAARAAKDDVCACTSAACRAEAQQRFTTAAAKIDDEQTKLPITAEMHACLAKAAPDPWEALVATACKCDRDDCAADIHERALALAPTTDLAMVRAQVARINGCLDSLDKGIAVLTKIRGEACVCKDAACIDKVQSDLAAAANVKTRNMDRATAIAGEIAECMASVGIADARPK
jgi:hypothetical protein